MIGRDRSAAVTDITIVTNLETTWMSKGHVGRDAIFLFSISTSWEVCKLREPGVKIVQGRIFSGLRWVLAEAVGTSVTSSEDARVILRELIRAGLRVRSEVLAESFHLLEERGRKRTRA